MVVSCQHTCGSLEGHILLNFYLVYQNNVFRSIPRDVLCMLPHIPRLHGVLLCQSFSWKTDASASRFPYPDVMMFPCTKWGDWTLPHSASPLVTQLKEKQTETTLQDRIPSRTWLRRFSGRKIQRTSSGSSPMVWSTVAIRVLSLHPSFISAIPFLPDLQFIALLPQRSPASWRHWAGLRKVEP